MFNLFNLFAFLQGKNESLMLESSTALYSRYKERMQKIADIRFASAVLQWDQETYLPPLGAEARGRQLATLAELAHREFTNPQTGALLQQLAGRSDLDFEQARNVQLSLEDYQKQLKYSPEWVRKLTETVHRSFHSWLDARKQNRFERFRSDLNDLVLLKREEAEILGYRHHPYDALLNDHDKGCTVPLLESVFDAIRDPLRKLLAQISNQADPGDHLLRQHFPRQQQWEFGMRVLRDLGYNFEAGRQDISEHPFTVNFSNSDVRITTRIDENDLGNMTWSCIHELGHALYEQGLPGESYGLPSGEPVSFSIHESQSRLWENHVGRSLAFCQHYLPVLQSIFPEQLGNADAETLYRAINRVRPSLIRTEADELSYHFHIMIRYELEKALIEGSLEANDVPAYWNEQYRKYLGVEVPDDRQGCLQDVHWSHGSFGYFPSYSLGSFYAAQFFARAAQNIPDLEDKIRKGDTRPLLDWLRLHLHREGRLYISEEICVKITGLGLDTGFFMSYVLDKYRHIYQL